MSADERTSSTTLGATLSTLKGTVGGLAAALGGRAVDKVTDKASALAQRLTDYAEGGSGTAAAAAHAAETLTASASPVASGLAAAVSGAKQKAADVKEQATELVASRRGGKKFSFNNIVEAIDVGAPVDVVYDAWTEYDAWPDFMKKVERAELDADEGNVTFKGKVLWSHREWETTITHQEPGRRILWESSGAKGHLSGTVTFHPLADDLTRILLVVEYYPQGFVEKTGNLWRAVNRRLRLELKLFVRYVMTQVVLYPEDLEGYRAEIERGEVTRTHDEVVEDEARQRDDEPGDDESDDYDDYGDDEYEDDDEGQYDDEEEGQYDDAAQDEDDDEYDDRERRRDTPAGGRRRRPA
jgi:uncharacterized membrane protein